MPFCYPTSYMIPTESTISEGRVNSYLTYVIADSIPHAESLIEARGLHQEQFETKGDGIPIELSLIQTQHPIIQRFSSIMEQSNWYSNIDSMIHQACFLSMCALSRKDKRIDPQFILGDASGMHELTHLKHLGPAKRKYFRKQFYQPNLERLTWEKSAIEQWKIHLTPMLRELEDATIGLFVNDR